LLELKQKKQPEKKEDKKQKKPDEQKDKSPSTMSQKEVTQRLKLLEEKEREIQKRVQKDKANSEGGAKGKDW
jgi:FixJ family two-component response regulator